MIYNQYFVIKINECTNLDGSNLSKYKLYINIKTNIKDLVVSKYVYNSYFSINTSYISNHLLDNNILSKEKYINGLLDINKVKSITEEEYDNIADSLKHTIEYYYRKKLYYVSELLTEDVGDYYPYPTGFRDLRVYEIINGELKDLYNIKHPMEEYCLDVLKEYLNEINYDGNDYEFIEL